MISRRLNLIYYGLLGIGILLAIICVVLILNTNWLVALITQHEKINPSDINLEGQYGYRFTLPLSAQQSIAPINLYENETLLDGVRSDQLFTIIKIGQGRYGRDNLIGQYSKYIYFSSTDNSDPRSNGKSYWVKYTYPVLTRSRMIFILGFDMIGLFSLMALRRILKLYPDRCISIITWLTRHQVTICLLAVILISLVLHWIWFISIPLQMSDDTIGYIEGVIGLLQDGNFSSVPTKRGPGMAILLAPLFWVFSDSLALPVKTLFHLMSIGGVFFVYCTAHNISHKAWFAFMCGLLTALSPDLLYYSNMLLSEIPTFFFTMLFAYLATRYFTSKKIKWLYLSAICVSFLSMIRTENRLLVIVLFFFVSIEIGYQWLKRDNTAAIRILFHGMLSLCIPVLTLFAWSIHNLTTNGFFGLTNYNFNQIYAGVITSSYKVGQYPPIINWDSPAVQKIDEAVKYKQKMETETNSTDELLEYQTGEYGVYDRDAVKTYYGYNTNEFSKIFTQAAIDSIKARPLGYLELLFLKINKAFTPDELIVYYGNYMNEFLTSYFQDNLPKPEELSFDIKVQKLLYGTFALFKKSIMFWRLFCIFGIFLCLLKKPAISWWFLCATTFASGVFPIILALPLTRYTIYGGALLNLTGIGAIWLIIGWLKKIGLSKNKL